MSSPIKNQLGTIFIPVSDIEKARDWYCDLLGMPSSREILFGHLYVLPMQGTGNRAGQQNIRTRNNY